MNIWKFLDGKKTVISAFYNAVVWSSIMVIYDNAPPDYLVKINRQAGVLAFLEVGKEWVPMGVWRFREIAKEALRKEPMRFDSLESAYVELKKRMALPLERWLNKSHTLKILKTQPTLESFFPKDVQG